jgi:hypothetical protein
VVLLDCLSVIFPAYKPRFTVIQRSTLLVGGKSALLRVCDTCEVY